MNDSEKPPLIGVVISKTFPWVMVLMHLLAPTQSFIGAILLIVACLTQSWVTVVAGTILLYLGHSLFSTSQGNIAMSSAVSNTTDALQKLSLMQQRIKGRPQ